MKSFFSSFLAQLLLSNMKSLKFNFPSAPFFTIDEWITFFNARYVHWTVVKIFFSLLLKKNHKKNFFLILNHCDVVFVLYIVIIMHFFTPTRDIQENYMRDTQTWISKGEFFCFGDILRECWKLLNFKFNAAPRCHLLTFSYFIKFFLKANFLVKFWK